MKRVSFLINIIFFQLAICPAIGQEKSTIKFGKISAEDFKPVYSIDSNAAAVVIADIGSADIVESGSWFQLEVKRFKRVHILKKEGYDNANVQILFFTSNTKAEPIENLKAVTYNMENGKVVDSKLNLKEGMFTDIITKNLVAKKFTFPNVKEGSIIEFEYKMVTNSLSNLSPWTFQGEFPELWSEYKVSIPEFFYYTFLPQGYQNYYIKEKKETSKGFILDLTPIYLTPTKVAFSAAIDEHRWVMKNVPGLKREPFTAALSNHISKIEFVLSAFRYPLPDKNFMLDWKDITSSLLKDEDFGLQYKKDNAWLNDEVSRNVKSLSGQMDKAKTIFNYVRDNFKCLYYNQSFPESSLKDILKNKSGGVASINLLLIAMLRKAGVAADPVMLSTKSHGYPPIIYPNINKFNYLICQAIIEGKKYYLDASRPEFGFGKLEWECFNGLGRVINDEATGIEFNSDSLLENNTVSIVLSNDDKGNLSGYIKKTPGYYESYRIRKLIKEKGKEEFLKETSSTAVTDITLKNQEIESLSQYDETLQLAYDMEMKNNGEDIFYLNPMFGEGYKENPFKSSTRLYPVEMPYTKDDVYILRMEIPKGYQLEELPKSTRLNYDDGGKSFFEYIISEKNGTIMLRSRIRIARTFFAPDEYEVLREFFAQIVNKHNEQIVFKRKK